MTSNGIRSQLLFIEFIESYLEKSKHRQIGFYQIVFSVNNCGTIDPRFVGLIVDSGTASPRMK